MSENRHKIFKKYERLELNMNIIKNIRRNK